MGHSLLRCLISHMAAVCFYVRPFRARRTLRAAFRLRPSLCSAMPRKASWAREPSPRHKRCSLRAGRSAMAYRLYRHTEFADISWRSLCVISPLPPSPHGLAPDFPITFPLPSFPYPPRCARLSFPLFCVCVLGRGCLHIFCRFRRRIVFPPRRIPAAVMKGEAAK